MQKDIINYTQGLLLEHIGRKFTKIYIEKYILPIITNIINSKKKEISYFRIARSWQINFGTNFKISN